MNSVAMGLDRILEVPAEEQAAYVEASYCDYLMMWRELEHGLADARRSGDQLAEARLSRELSELWPRPEAVARAAGLLKLAS